MFQSGLRVGRFLVVALFCLFAFGASARCVSASAHESLQTERQKLAEQLQKAEQERDQARSDHEQAQTRAQGGAAEIQTLQKQLSDLQKRLRAHQRTIAALRRQNRSRAGVAANRSTVATSATQALPASSPASPPGPGGDRNSGLESSGGDRAVVEQLRRELGGDVRIERQGDQLRIVIENRRVLLIVEDQASSATPRPAPASSPASAGDDRIDLRR